MSREKGICDGLYWKPTLNSQLSIHTVGHQLTVVKFQPIAGHRLLEKQARINHFTIEQPASLTYLPETGQYTYCAMTSRDISNLGGETCLIFAGGSGQVLHLDLPTGQALGGTVETWLIHLHKASFGGLPYKLFVFFIGLVITMLSVTGIYIWYKKHRAARLKRKVMV